MRHIVVTGATDGIGKVTARELGAADTTIWIIGRDAAKTQTVLRELSIAKPAAKYEGLVADLSRPAQVREVAKDLQSRLSHLDVLINNAGAFFSTFERTPEGFERTFALNHLNYFILTSHLLPLLRAAPRGRIVSVASEAHRQAKLDFNNLNGEHGFNGWRAYSNSKLCNILFTRELAKRLAGSSVVAYSLHPGFVASKFGHNNGGFGAGLLKMAQRLLAIDEDAGARTSVYLASSPDVGGVSGDYFDKCKPRRPTAAALDDRNATRLWTVTEQLAGAWL